MDLSSYTDHHIIAGTFKMMFREMTEPLLTFDLYKNFLGAHGTLFLLVIQLSSLSSLSERVCSLYGFSCLPILSFHHAPPLIILSCSAPHFLTICADLKDSHARSSFLKALLITLPPVHSQLFMELLQFLYNIQVHLSLLCPIPSRVYAHYLPSSPRSLPLVSLQILFTNDLRTIYYAAALFGKSNDE